MTTLDLLQSTPFTSSIISDIGNDFSFSRSTVAWGESDTGVWEQVGINTPHHNSNGLLIEPDKTNFCTNFNASPDVSITDVTATSGSVTRVDDTANLALAGLENICTQYAFTYTNGTGSDVTITIDGASGNSNDGAIQLWGFSTGTACTMQLTGADGAIPIPLGTTYTRVRSEGFAQAGTEEFQIIVPPAATITWVLNQFETGDNTTEAGCTGPIVVAGSSETRTLPQLSAVATNVPNIDYCIYLEITPNSYLQDTGKTYAFDIYVNGSNRMRMYGKAELDKIVSGSTDTARGKYAYQIGRTSSIIAQSSSTKGTVPVVDSWPPNTDAPTATDSLALSGGTIYLGRKSDGTQSFNGRIRNFRIINGDLSLDALRQITNNRSEINLIEGRGVPIQKSGGELIALGGWDGTNYTKIESSIDYGTTWTTRRYLDGETNQSPLNQDNAGNFYYSTSNTLRRIDASYIEDNVVLIWDDALLVSPLSRSWSYFSWAWGEDTEGNLYTAAYTLDGLQGQIFYKTTDNGLTWVANTSLATQFTSERHIHSLHVNPADNRLYVSIGDDVSRRNLVSDADLSTWDGSTWDTIISTDASGATGLTFTSEATYWSSDIQGDQNYLTRVVSDTLDTTVVKMPSNFHTTPVYYLRAQGDNKLWSVSYNETAIDTASGGLMLWEKLEGSTSEWKLSRILVPDDANFSSDNLYALGWNLEGCIAENAEYIFVERRTYPGKKPNGLYRIAVNQSEFVTKNSYTEGAVLYPTASKAAEIPALASPGFVEAPLFTTTSA